jgi:Bacterial protein of unknown function (DUF922)
MPIAIVPLPVTLSWSDFATVNSLSNQEDAHIDPSYEVQNRPLRRVHNQFMLAETLEVRVHPRARVLNSANQSAGLLAHEQGHYDIGILAARALSADLASLSAKTPAELSRLLNDTFVLHTRTRLRPIQHAYDTATNHSQNTQEQQRWSQMIATAMANASATSINSLPL